MFPTTTVKVATEPRNVFPTIGVVVASGRPTTDI